MSASERCGRWLAAVGALLCGACSPAWADAMPVVPIPAPVPEAQPALQLIDYNQTGRRALFLHLSTHDAAALATSSVFEDPADDPRLSYRPSALVLFNSAIDNGPSDYCYDLVAGYWQGFSPLHNVQPRHPPTLIMLGTRDAFVLVAIGQAYCSRVRAAGANFRFALYEGQPHAFFARNRSPRYYAKTLAAMGESLGALGYLPAVTD